MPCPITKGPTSGPCSVPSMYPFTPRPFPPPSLVDIPIEYIIQQLHILAPEYWNNAETTDCTIIVPVPHCSRGRSKHLPDALPLPPGTMGPRSRMRDPSGLGRRVTLPTLLAAPRISLELHMDYLSSHSTLLRGLFSGASPLNLINTASTCPPAFSLHSNTASSQFVVPADRLPRLLSSSQDHPVLFLPIPDPFSFHFLVHWMYFGRLTYIEDALLQGAISWEGVARNAEYLGLRHEIRIFLSRWYGNWLHPNPARYSNSCPGLSDDEFSDYDGDASSTTSSQMDGESAGEEIFDDPPRGRATMARDFSGIGLLRQQDV